MSTYVYLLILFGLGTWVIERGGRTKALEVWVIFLAGFFFGVVLGVPVLHWLGHLFSTTPQPPGQVGGGGTS